jgi:Zn-dependent protease with chaperone function
VAAVSPAGVEWSVRVVWEPRWRALARRFGGWRRRRKDAGGSGGGWDLPFPDVNGLDGDGCLVAIGVVLAIIVFGLLFWWLLLPLLLLFLDLVAVVLLLVIGIVARVLFRRPWIVQATAITGETVTVNVVGWRRALRRRDELAEQLRHGLTPDDAVPPAADPAASL